MEYYLAIKKNTFESVLMRWMKLEKEKDDNIKNNKLALNPIISITILNVNGLNTPN